MANEIIDVIDKNGDMDEEENDYIQLNANDSSDEEYVEIKTKNYNISKSWKKIHGRYPKRKASIQRIRFRNKI